MNAVRYHSAFMMRTSSLRELIAVGLRASVRSIGWTPLIFDDATPDRQP